MRFENVVVRDLNNEIVSLKNIDIDELVYDILDNGRKSYKKVPLDIKYLLKYGSSDKNYLVELPFKDYFLDIVTGAEEGLKDISLFDGDDDFEDGEIEYINIEDDGSSVKVRLSAYGPKSCDVNSKDIYVTVEEKGLKVDYSEWGAIEVFCYLNDDTIDTNKKFLSSLEEILRCCEKLEKCGLPIGSVYIDVSEEKSTRKVGICANYSDYDLNEDHDGPDLGYGLYSLYVFI